MGMVGRKPKPAELKLVTSKHGKSKAVREVVEEFADMESLREPPDWLTQEQVDEWNFIIDNAAPGILRRVDRATLASYCVAYTTYKEAVLAVRDMGMVTLSPVKNEPMQSPYLSIMNRQAQLMLKAASEMGLTPTARTRVAQLGGSGRGKAKDEFDF